jgi:hypothetical protein
MGAAISPFKFIHENGLTFAEGSVVKYVCRWRKKNGLEDLKKAIHYLQLIIEEEESRSQSDVQIETDFSFPQQEEGLEA